MPTTSVSFQMRISNVTKLTFVTIYFMCMVVQIFIPSYFASRLLHKSMDTTNAIYSSEWLDQDMRNKKAYMIFVTRTYKPMTIYAGQLFLLSLPTFVSVNYFSANDDCGIRIILVTSNFINCFDGLVDTLLPTFYIIA